MKKHLAKTAGGRFERKSEASLRLMKAALQKNTFNLESSKRLLPYRRPNKCKSDHKLNTLRALFKGVNMLIWHQPGKHHGVAVAQFA